MASAPGTLRYAELASTPSTPPAGYVLMYVKTNNVVYILDSGGVETPLGSSSAITSLTGEATGTGPGATVVTLSNAAIIGKVLTGFSAGPNSTVLATDTILQAIQKLQAQVSASVSGAITSLTGDVTATGPGAAAAAVAFVGTSSAANVHLAELAANAATSVNTPSTIVKRDGSGNFAAGTITANLTGNVSGSSGSFTGSLVGDVTGTQGATVVSLVGTSTASNVHLAELAANAATSSNTPSTIVKRDGSGNFAAGVITANLTGNVTGNVSGTAANVTGIVAVANGGTNSSAALANNRVMVSSGGAIVEAAAITGNRALASNASGIPVASATTDTELGFVSGVTSSIQTQLNGKQATGNYITALTGDVTATGPGSVAATIAANAVTNAKLAQMPANTIKGNNTGGTANALDLTVAQVNTMLGNVTVIGTIDGNGASANGLSISGNSLFAQSASATNPGMVNNTTQTMSGNKTFSGQTAISNTSTTALTINSTAFVFDATNNALGIGQAPAAATFVDAMNSSGASKTLQLTGYGTGSTVGTRGRFARGTSGSPTAAQTGDIINFWSARGYGATQFAAASTGAINAVAGENFTDTSNLTYLAFNTTPTGSVTSTENARIASTGVTLGPQTASTSVHAINGGLKVTRRTITANLTIDTTTSDYLILCNHSGAITVTLPTPTDGRNLVIKDISGAANTNNVTIARHASEKIEGLAASFIFQTNWGVLNIYSDGTDWYLN